MYQPTEEQMRQAEAVIERCSLTIGRFIVAWARIETRLRALEFMHVGDHRFQPVADLNAIDLKKSLRFRKRVKLLPDRPEGAEFGIRDWLIEANKIRNLVIHGELQFMEHEGEGIATPVIMHSDYAATMMVSKGFPATSEIHAPSYKGSARADKMVDVPRLDKLTDQAKQVEEVLVSIIAKTHGIDLNLNR